MRHSIRCAAYALLTCFLFSCQDKPVTPPPETPKPIAKPTPPPIPAPDFNPDSAYSFIQRQVNIGPRVPNTEAHRKCAEYLEQKLRAYEFEVVVQEAQVTAFSGKTLDIKNIIGRFAPKTKNRIMLFAHWDTRPFADRDTKAKGKPIDGANDGGSGVGVLLEIARLLWSHDTVPRIGVDIIFFDAEDYGQPQETMLQQRSNTWCLGTQYWAKNPPIKEFNPKYGILLDMVGATNATFPKESYSMYFAAHVVNKVWAEAKKLGYDDHFTNAREFRGLTDDHLYVNTIAKIPSIDIVHYRTDVGDFGEFHHTHKDNMDIIDKNTLKAVGQTVIQVIYSEY